MFLKPPPDDYINVFLHGSGAADQHHFGFYLIPQGPGAIKTILIIPNVIKGMVINRLNQVWLATQDASTFTGRSVNDEEVKRYIKGLAKP